VRKLINWATLLYFIWLIIDAFGILSLLIDFIIVGAIPGTNTTIPAGMMLALIGVCAGLLLLEIASRHVTFIYRVRRHLMQLSGRRDSLPQRRFSRI